MIQYLIILLSDSSTSYCHYENVSAGEKLIPIEILRKGIRYAMLENWMIQFVYPTKPMPEDYAPVIESIDNFKVKPLGADCSDADAVIINSIQDIDGATFDAELPYVLRLTKSELFESVEKISELLPKVKKLNIVIQDVETFTDDDFETYKDVLATLAKDIEAMYVDGKSPQLNILTDRMMLKEMNNCGAGDTNITLAPDGNFYLCPAFYYDKAMPLGNVDDGIDIRNPQLLKLDHAPLCRICDAYQCKRCVWLNRKITLEVNTPSHEQCVVAHLERNASRELLNAIREHGTFLPDCDEIKEISYLDPFDVKEQW